MGTRHGGWQPQQRQQQRQPKKWAPYVVCQTLSAAVGGMPIGGTLAAIDAAYISHPWTTPPTTTTTSMCQAKRPERGQNNSSKPLRHQPLHCVIWPYPSSSYSRHLQSWPLQLAVMTLRKLPILQRRCKWSTGSCRHPPNILPSTLEGCSPCSATKTHANIHRL